MADKRPIYKRDVYDSRRWSVYLRDRDGFIQTYPVHFRLKRTAQQLVQNLLDMSPFTGQSVCLWDERAKEEVLSVPVIERTSPAHDLDRATVRGLCGACFGPWPCATHMGTVTFVETNRPDHLDFVKAVYYLAQAELENEA